MNEERAAIRRLLMYWGNAERARREKAEHIVEIEAEIEALYGLRSTKLSGMPHGSGISDPTSAAVIRNEKRIKGLQATKDKVQAEIDELDYRAGLIEYEVMCLPPLESEVIRLRYIRYGVAKKGYWQRIARRAHVSEDHAKTLERNGVDRLRGNINLTRFNTLNVV
jgi:hypothetical protein